MAEIGDGYLLVADDTGCVLLKLYNSEFYDSFEVGQNVIFSGVIETFDCQKCITNPLLKVYIQGKYAEVFPVYSENFQIEKNDIEDENLIAIHGFSTKEGLAKARHAMKLKQIEQCKQMCLKLGTSMKQELLRPFPCSDNFNNNVRLITRFDEGEEAQAIKNVRNSLVICPLAYMSSDERNSKVYDYGRISKVPESKPHPNISVETDEDCDCNSDGVKKREMVLSEVLHANVKATAKVSDSADLVVVEDADRISTLEIDYWMRQAQCDFLLVLNSNSTMQLSRLEFLCESHTQEEVLWNELSYRRDGDILGCRNPLFKGLSLVNLSRMKSEGTVFV